MAWEIQLPKNESPFSLEGYRNIRESKPCQNTCHFGHPSSTIALGKVLPNNKINKQDCKSKLWMRMETYYKWNMMKLHTSFSNVQPWRDFPKPVAIDLDGPWEDVTYEASLQLVNLRLEIFIANISIESGDKWCQCCTHQHTVQNVWQCPTFKTGRIGNAIFLHANPVFFHPFTETKNHPEIAKLSLSEVKYRSLVHVFHTVKPPNWQPPYFELPWHLLRHPRIHGMVIFGGRFCKAFPTRPYPRGANLPIWENQHPQMTLNTIRYQQMTFSMMAMQNLNWECVLFSSQICLQWDLVGGFNPSEKY